MSEELFGQDRIVLVSISIGAGGSSAEGLRSKLSGGSGRRLSYPWMAAKAYGYHWGRSLESSSMWAEAELYRLSLSYFRDSIQALKGIIDPDQVEEAFSPSEHVIGADYLRGFRDAGMVVCLSNWQAIFGPERHEAKNTSQWFYTMYRGQEGDSGPSNWEPVVYLSGITARNLGIDIDTGGTNFFPEAAFDLAWMNDNGWLTDYSDRSVEVVSIMDAWRFWRSSLWMLGQGCSMSRTATTLRIGFYQDADLMGLTWMLPSADASGQPHVGLYLDGLPILPDLTDGGYVFWTSGAAPGFHTLEVVYGIPQSKRFPIDNDPPDITYTYSSTGNRIIWVISGWDEPQGSYVIKRNLTQVAFGKWHSYEEIIHGIDGLEPGSYYFSLVYWDSSSPRQIDTVHVLVLHSHEPACLGVLSGLLAILATLLRRSRQAVGLRASVARGERGARGDRRMVPSGHSGDDLAGPDSRNTGRPSSQDLWT